MKTPILDPDAKVSLLVIEAPVFNFTLEVAPLAVLSVIIKELLPLPMVRGSEA